MQRLRNVLLVCVSALLFSCSQIPLSNGDLTTRLDTIDSTFRVVMLCDNVDVNLQHATPDHIAGSYHISTGENLIDRITVEHPIHEKDTSFDTILICNHNVMNWLRPYDYQLTLTLFYDSISEIIFNSNGSLETDAVKGVFVQGENEDDIWGFGDRKMKLTIEGGSGNVKLRVDCYQLDTDYTFGTANVSLLGRSPITTTHCSYNSHGPIDAKDLWTNYHYIFHYGTNYIYAFARHQIYAHNFNNGIVYYVVNPTQHIPETLDTIGPRIYPYTP